MSFDDYANHIYQKYRLCLALVVIKTKPPDLNTEEYIKQLSSKMADVMDIDDVTICSEDFMTDCDESFNILKSYDGIGVERREVTVEAEPQDYNSVQKSLPVNQSQTTYFSSQSQYVSNNINITDDITHYIDEEITNKQRELKSIDNFNYIQNVKSNLNIEEFTSNRLCNIEEMARGDCIKSQSITTISRAENLDTDDPTNKETTFKDSCSKDINLANDLILDSQKTIPYTLYGFTQNDSHYSQSQSQIFVPNKYLYSLKNDKSDVEYITDANHSINNTNNIQYKLMTDKKHEINSKEIKNVILPVEKVYTINNLSEHIDNYSQNKEIDNTASIYTTSLQNEENVSNMILEDSLGMNEYFNEINTFNVIGSLNNGYNELKTNTNDITKGLSQNSELDQTMNYFDDTEFINTDPLPNSKYENKPTRLIANRNNIVSSQNLERKAFFTGVKNNIKIVDTEMDDMNSKELIPYKVLEELNKIKIYLRRKERRRSTEGYSTDSGYRSDSQPLSFSRSSLQSSASINQSAYCLLNHILRCPLLAATRDITEEISQTLADLIDRLHDEELYPPFLEELLDTVDILVRQVYKARNSTESEFLNKDEFIQRALFLNKSIHIQKHCIEKLTNMLITFHEKVSDINVIYELTNLDEIENISYIFQILEILLKKYIKKKDITSQNNSQISQNKSHISQDEDNILKRSSITDIWRKKWNANIRDISVGSREDRCVLKSCSEILNKLIVDCMNSYSLVAYSALKCFNILQQP